VLLEFLDLSTQRRLSGIQGFCGSSKALMLSDREEIFEMPEFCEVVHALNLHWRRWPNRVQKGLDV
jgi:hypothetical protein